MGVGGMDSGWYSLKRGAPTGQQEGPFTWDELYGRAAAGCLAADDLVWHPQLPEWTAAGQVSGLIPTASLTAPARPAGPPPLPDWAQAPAPRTGRPVGPPPLPTWSQTAGPPPLPAWSAPAGPPPLPVTRRRPSWLLPVLVPLIAIILIGAALGTYFGAFYHKSDGAVTQHSTVSSGGVAGPATPATQDTAPYTAPDAAETAAVKLPDPARLIDTASWGKVPANEVCVVLADDKTRADADALAQTLGGSVVGEIAVINGYQIETAATTEADLEAAIAKARASDGVTYAVPEQTVVPKAAGEIWGVRISPLSAAAYAGENGDGYGLIGTQAAWDYINGSGLELSPTQVGIVDSGLYPDSSRFNGGVNLAYTDPSAKLGKPEQVTYSDGSSGSDLSGGHGTGSAAMIGSSSANGGPTGVASIFGGLLTISSTNQYAAPYGTPAGSVATPAPADPDNPAIAEWDGTSYSFSALAAIMAQVKAGSTVINLSWGADINQPVDPQTAALFKTFFTKLSTRNPKVLFVVAAGNDGVKVDGDRYYPAGLALPNMITVGNVDNDGTMHAGKDGSNLKSDNFEVTLSAPGDRAVRGYDPQSGQALAQGGGTSMAAPQVAATAALLKGILPDLDAKQIKQILQVTARKNAAGDPIVAVDEAVYEVIRLKCKIDGLDVPSRDELRNRGVIDAVATPVQGTPGDYFVRAIVQSLANINGTDLTLEASPGRIVEGENPRHLAEAGELGWVVHLDDPNGTITVHRMDNLAGSRITLEMPDVNGMWTGTVTFTQLTGNVEQAADDEGCDIALLRTLLNKPFPMTMEIKVDGNGTGRATVNIDLSSLNTDTVKARMDPVTFSVQLSASALSFEDTLLQGATVSMGGSVANKGDALTMTGPFGLSMQGVGAKANYKVTKQ